MSHQQGVSYNTYCLKRESIMAGSGNDLPDAFDVIVVGTGLEESMVAAAASRVGHTVLHLDPNNYYGRDWAAFTLEGIQSWMDQQSEQELKNAEVDENATCDLLQEGEELIRLDSKSTFTSVQSRWHHVPPTDDNIEREKTNNLDPAVSTNAGLSESEGATAEAEKDIDGGTSTASQVPSDTPKVQTRWPKHKVMANSRKFNLDLTPRLLYSRGSMVELLISSNISRYAEFKACSRVLTVKDGKLEHVPSSRADVFATKHVSVVEKRILMKFITFCVDFQSHPQVYEKFKDKSYLEFLKHEKLTGNLIEFVMTSIAMVDASATCIDGLEATQKFLTSIGRFGNTPFLWSMYGSGELPQAFCRLAAVFGATYFLGRPLEGVIVGEASVAGILFNGKRIACKHLVADSRLFPRGCTWKTVTEEWSIARKICLLEDSVMPAEKEQLTFVSLPPKGGDGHYTYVKEVGFGTAACPKSMYVLHLTTRGGNSNNDPQEVDETRVLKDPKSRLIWSSGFTNRVEAAQTTISNLQFCSGPRFELDYDQAISHAKKIFAKMFGPNTEFLPRAPDPEEFIIGRGEGEPTNNNTPLKRLNAGI